MSKHSLLKAAALQHVETVRLAVFHIMFQKSKVVAVLTQTDPQVAPADSFKALTKSVKRLSPLVDSKLRVASRFSHYDNTGCDSNAACHDYKHLVLPQHFVTAVALCT